MGTQEQKRQTLEELEILANSPINETERKVIPDDGEIELDDHEKTTADFINFYGKTRADLSFDELLLLDWTQSYDRTKNTRFRMMTLRLMIAEEIGLLGMLIFFAAKIPPELLPSYSEGYVNLFWALAVFLILWSVGEEIFDFHQEKMEMILLPDFGSDTRRERISVEEQVKHMRIDTAIDYNLPNLVKTVKKQNDTLWRTQQKNHQIELES